MLCVDKGMFQLFTPGWHKLHVAVDNGTIHVAIDCVEVIMYNKIILLNIKCYKCFWYMFRYLHVLIVSHANDWIDFDEIVKN